MALFCVRHSAPHAMPCRQLKVPNMAPAYSLKKSHLPSSEGAACCPSSSCSRLPQRTPAVAHLIKDLDVDNPRLELTLAQRLGTAAPSAPPLSRAAQAGAGRGSTSAADAGGAAAPSPHFRLFASFYCRAAMGGGGAKGARAQRQRASVSHMQRAVQTRRPSAPSRAKIMRSALTSRR